jgi:uncharacterized protein YbaA (DUF1428 family)
MRMKKTQSKPKAGYVDGFVFAVPKKNFAAYKKMATDAGKIWRKHGALEYIEAMGDDLAPPMVSLTFPKLTKLKPDETVWFSFITFKNRKHRDAVNKKVMIEMDEKYKDKSMPMPFDMKRMAYGGFKPIVNTK